MKRNMNLKATAGILLAQATMLGAIAAPTVTALADEGDAKQFTVATVRWTDAWPNDFLKEGVMAEMEEKAGVDLDWQIYYNSDWSEQKSLLLASGDLPDAFVGSICLNSSDMAQNKDYFVDLTPYIREKDNVLAVEIHKMCSAAFLEDQDFFRFFGIFRNVTLRAVPEIHLEDVWFRPELNKDNASGKLSVNLKVSAPENRKINARFVLKDQEGSVVLEKSAALQEKNGIYTEEIQTDDAQVKAWDNHHPYLYHVYVELTDESGNLSEVVPYDIGFSRIDVIDKVSHLNGKRLVLTGVNRHEWSPKTGRCISMNEMKSDIECILRNNINAVRTCHYPDQIPWYYMCDAAGIYMMAENNLESHGTFQKLGAIEPSCNVPGSIPQWKEAVVDRARSNFETFKNHTAILFWSLGNESYAGDDKEKQDGHLIHYESSF